MASPVRVVVARHQEDISWADDTPWHVVVVQKDRDLPNEGREASSYFWALHRLYDKVGPADVVACVQGDPLAHCNTLYETLAQSIEEFTPLGRETECDLDGVPEHPGLPVGALYRQWFEGEPPARLRFVAGAQFALTGREIHRYPQSFYAAMVPRMSERDAPWVMERLWPHLFTTETPLFRR